MKKELVEEILLQNPWIETPLTPILELKAYRQRAETSRLLSPEWDELWLTLIGPRRAGKTTLGKYLSHKLLEQGRYKNLLYLNCDYYQICDFITSPLSIKKLIDHFKLAKPIIFLDEVQRLENPGLTLKAFADLKLPVKMIASGSSQLEMKSKIKEHLTGRQLMYLVLPFSVPEINNTIDYKTLTIYGSFPQVLNAKDKETILAQLYRDYIKKDIIEFLKIAKPTVMEKLLTLIAHATGQLVNYQQLAIDCQISNHILKNYISILEETYVIKRIRPFVGNKRSEVTKNPVIYFIDNGFRNYALSNFALLDNRTDCGFLIQSFVFQELYKLRAQHFLHFDIQYWRTKSGAEIDFILHKNEENFIPIEVKYRNMKTTKIPRALRSFIQAYHPKNAIVITKDWFDTQSIDNCQIHFAPVESINDILGKIYQLFSQR